MIQVGRESVSLDPTATTSQQTLLIQKTRNEEVISALSVLGSRRVFEGVVHKIGATAVLDGYLPSENDPPQPEHDLVAATKQLIGSFFNILSNGLVLAGLRDELSDEEMAIRDLQKNVEIFAPRESAVLSVKTKAASPQMAQAITQTVIDTFIEQHMEVSRTPGSYEFFERQCKEVQTELDQLLEVRTQFLNDHDLISIASNQAVLQEQLTATSKQLLDSEGQLNQTVAQIDDAKNALETIPKEILAGKQERENTVYGGMRQKLFELQVTERRYNQTLAPDHPKLMVVKNQIAELQSILEEVSPDQIEQNTTVNPERQRVEGDIQKLVMTAAGLRSMIAEKRTQRDEINGKINELAKAEESLRAIDRDVALKEVSLQSLRVKLEEARVIKEMGRDRISNVSVFQPASLIERPTNPKKRPLAALFLAMGVLVGLVAAYAREASLKTLRTSQHVCAATGAAPVYPVGRSWRLKNNRRVFRKLPKDLGDVCKSILSDVLLTHDWGEHRAVGVLGVDAGCGASSLATSLSLVSSDDCGIDTLLVDADGKGRSVSRTFKLGRVPGLTELAKGTAEIDECLHRQDDKLSLVPFSSPSIRSHRLNGSFDGVVASLTELRSQSDVVIVDLPPASESPEAIALARELDYVVVVLESEKTTSNQASKLLRHLDAGQTQIIGVVLNKTKQHTPRWLNYFAADGES